MDSVRKEALAVVIPHGIGDIIMINEVIERFWLENNKIPMVVFVKKSIYDSKLLDNAPWCVAQRIVPDIWHDYGLFGGKISWNTAYEMNMLDSQKEAIKFNHDQNEYTIVSIIQLKLEFCIPPQRMHRYQAACIDLAIDCPYRHFDKVYISDNDVQKAKELLYDKQDTLLWLVDDREHWEESTVNTVREFVDLKFGKYVTIINSRLYKGYGINVCFAMMKMCQLRVVPESCWYHAASAMGIDLNYVITHSTDYLTNPYSRVIFKKDNIKFEVILLEDIKGMLK